MASLIIFPPSQVICHTGRSARSAICPNFYGIGLPKKCPVLQNQKNIPEPLSDDRKTFDISASFLGNLRPKFVYTIFKKKIMLARAEF